DSSAIVQEDDADRVAWRGTSSTIAPPATASMPSMPSAPGMASGTGATPGGLPAFSVSSAGQPTGPQPTTRCQLPDWLAACTSPGAFGHPPAQMPNQASPSNPGMGSAPGAAAAARDPRDPWAQSLSGMQTGQMGAFTPGQAAGSGPAPREPG